MKKQYLTSALSFANTAAGKFVAILVAMAMVLSLSSIALAVDGAVQAMVGGQELAEQGASQTPTSTDEGAGPEGEEAASEASSGEGLGGVTASESSADESASGTEDASEEEAETEATLETTEEAIQKALNAMAGSAAPLEAPTAKVDEATVRLIATNCAIVVGGQSSLAGEGEPAESTATVPLYTDLTFSVVPTNGYNISNVSAQWGIVALQPEENADGTYTIAADFVDSTLAIMADASTEGAGQVEKPSTDPVKDDTVVVAPGTYESLVVSVEDLVFTYMGTELPASPADITASVEGLLDGDVFVVTGFDGQPQKDVTTGVPEAQRTLTVTDYAILRDGIAVTEEYKDATFVKGTALVTINKADLFITTPSASKAYDGTPLTCEGTQDDPAELYELLNYDGPEINSSTFKVTGKQDGIGSSPNSYYLAPEILNYLSRNYNIKLNLGTLTVTPPDEAAYVIAPSASKSYDGTPLRAGALSWVGLPSGYTVQGTVTNASLTNAGKVRTSVDRSSIKVRDAAGKDVTDIYKNSIEILDGELLVDPAYLYVLTFSESKTADGTPLTAGGELAGLIVGETASFAVTGSQTAAGSSKNTYTIVWNGTAKQSNYRVVEDLGTLTVKAAPAQQPANTNTGNTGGGATGGTNTPTPSPAPTGNVVYYTGSANTVASAPTTNGAYLPASPSQTDSEEEDDSGLNPAVEAVATGLQNAEQIMRGQEPTDLIAPATEEILTDDETPLGVFDKPLDCWVHWYAILGLIATAIYGGVVMFFRRAYAYELESREADILGVPVGLAQPHVPAGTSGKAGREA